MAEYRNSPGVEPADPRDAELASLRVELAAAESAMDEQRTRAKRAEAEVERLKARPVGVPAEVRAALIHAVDPEFNGGADAAKARAWLASTADGATSERDGAK